MWQINWNLNKSYIFLIQGQTHSFVFNLVPGMLEIAFQGFEISKFSVNYSCMEHAAPPDPPGGMGLLASCWYSQLLYSNLLATSIIIETPWCHSLSYLLLEVFFRACISTWASFSLASRLKISSQILVSSFW